MRILRELPERSKHRQKQFLCQCECGATRVVASSDLEKTKGCKECSRTGNRGKSKKSLVNIGDRFGYFQVMDKAHGIYWKCHCLACGKTDVLKSSEKLRNNRVYNLHCGCLGGKKQYPPTPKELPPEVWAMVAKYRSMLNHLEDKNLDYDIGLSYLIRACWIFWHKKGEGIKDEKAYIFSWIRHTKSAAKKAEKDYNYTHVNSLIGCDMTTTNVNISLTPVEVGTSETQADIIDRSTRKPRKIKFARK